MNKNVRNILEGVLYLGGIALFYFYEWLWLLEILFVILVIKRIRIEVVQREAFQEILPEQVEIIEPLQIELNDVFKFLFYSLVLIFSIVIYFTNDFSSVEGASIIIGGLIYGIPNIITFLHQLAYPRKLYVDNDFIYYHSTEIIKIPWKDIEEIELSNTLITFYEEKHKNVLTFKKPLTETDFIKWNNLLNNGLQEKKYKYINATIYKMLKKG
jgi:hypothetical protein